ncbi:MAG: hypothetical protein ACM3QU_07285 [Verrucomicrobiota bacterium]
MWRTEYSPEWVTPPRIVAAWMAEAGLDVRRDAVGNVWGRSRARAGYLWCEQKPASRSRFCSPRVVSTRWLAASGVRNTG